MRTLWLIALLAVTGLACSEKPKSKTKPIPSLRIVLVGDSTVTDARGWGKGFAQLAGPDVSVSNVAAGGRSSKSFRAEGLWDKALSLKGNYLLIQFGHNDQTGKGVDRGTDAATTFKDNLVRYATEAKASGATPVLITSLARRTFGPDGHIHSDMTAYVDATKAAAREAGVGLIDLHARSLDYFERLGRSECERIEPRDPTAPDGLDATHVPPAWRKPLANLVVQELQQVEPKLAGKFMADSRP